MAITNAAIIQWVQAHVGSERDTGILKPLIVAMADLAYQDLARVLLDTDSELAKKLTVSLANQTWATSKFSAPTNMLFHKQEETTIIDFGGVPAFQLKDRDKMNMLNGVSNHYYALEGKTFYIRHSAGTTGASNLNISYYKIPTKDDIDDELRNLFLELLIKRLVPSKQAAQ